MLSRAFFPMFLAALAAADIPLPPIRSERGRRLSAASLPDLHVQNLRLSAVHASRIEDGTLVHTRHEVEVGGQSQLRRAQAFPANPREEIRQLLAVVVAARPDLHPDGNSTNTWGMDVYGPIFQEGDSLHGPDVQDRETEVTLDSQLYANIVASLEAAGDFTEDPGGLGIDTGTRGSRGVHALEFYRAGYGTVLAFRDTYSAGDRDQIKLWFKDWFLTRMDAQLKYQWINGAGLPWTAEMMGRERVIDSAARLVLQGDNWAGAGGHLGAMQELAANYSVEADAAAETGYWEFSKLIAETVRNETVGSMNAGERLILTGWSQGGARAALISMYLEKRYGEIYDTYTFGATGGSCFSRRFSYGSGNLLDDVDPYVQHEQIRDYTHVLDVYGNMDYDPGYQCRWGTTAIAESKAAEYCGHVFGYSGAHIMTAGGVGGLLGESFGESQNMLAVAFSRCIYFTHSRQAILQLYTNNEYLLEDGTTDGGCALIAQIPEEDPQALCPTGVGLRERDGCNDQLSCGACVVSDSSDVIVGFQCFWCEETRSCRSRGTTMFFEGCPSSWLGPPSAPPSDGSDLEFRQNHSFAANDAALISHAFDADLAEVLGVSREEVLVERRFTFHVEYAGPAAQRQQAEDAIFNALAPVRMQFSGEGGQATAEIWMATREEALRIAPLTLTAPAAAEGFGWNVVGVPQVEMEILGGVMPPRQCTADMADQVFDANNAVVNDAVGLRQQGLFLPLAAALAALLA